MFRLMFEYSFINLYIKKKKNRVNYNPVSVKMINSNLVLKKSKFCFLNQYHLGIRTVCGKNKIIFYVRFLLIRL